MHEMVVKALVDKKQRDHRRGISGSYRDGMMGNGGCTREEKENQEAERRGVEVQDSEGKTSLNEGGDSEASRTPWARGNNPWRTPACWSPMDHEPWARRGTRGRK